MTRVAFIRGINVGGHNKVPMAALRTTLTDAGFTNVRTYIQSGNVVYDPPPRTSADAALVAKLIARDFGIAPVVMSFDAGELARHLAASPFGDEDPAKSFLVFVDGDPAALGDPARDATDGESTSVVDGVIHLHCPNGLGRSKLAARYAAAKAVPTTTRNLRTVAAVLQLADQ